MAIDPAGLWAGCATRSPARSSAPVRSATAPPSPRRRKRSSPSSTRRAAPMPPASARTPWRACGSSPAPARSPSTAATARSISPGRCCACCSISPSSSPTGSANTMSSARWWAAGCRARPAPCATASASALTFYEPDLRPTLKAQGFLTRDSRVVERKKYGKAQGATQLPVLEALIPQARRFDPAKGRPAGRPFRFRQEVGRWLHPSTACASPSSARAAIPAPSCCACSRIIPQAEIAALTADRQAGQARSAPCSRISRGRNLPDLVAIDEVDWSDGRSRLLLPAARHDAGGGRGAAAPSAHPRPVGRFPPCRSRGLCHLVRPCASRAGAAARGGLWPHRDRARGGRQCAARRRARLLSDRGAAAADPAGRRRR